MDWPPEPGATKNGPCPKVACKLPESFRQASWKLPGILLTNLEAKLVHPSSPSRMPTVSLQEWVPSRPIWGPTYGWLTLLETTTRKTLDSVSFLKAFLKASGSFRIARKWKLKTSFLASFLKPSGTFRIAGKTHKRFGKLPERLPESFRNLPELR